MQLHAITPEQVNTKLSAEQAVFAHINLLLAQRASGAKEIIITSDEIEDILFLAFQQVSADEVPTELPTVTETYEAAGWAVEREELPEYVRWIFTPAIGRAK